METSDASGKIVLGVEKSGVAIGDFNGTLQQLLRYGGARSDCGLAVRKHLHGPLGPDCPVTQKAASEVKQMRLPCDLNSVWCQKVHHDVVVVAGVERNLHLRFSNGADSVKRLVAIKWSNLDGDNIFD